MPRLALMQINPTVGDLDANAALMRGAFAKAMDAQPDLVIFPSGALSGMPAGGLANDADFLARGKALLASLSADFSEQALFREIFQTSAQTPLDPRIHIGQAARPYYRGGPHAAWRKAGGRAVDEQIWLAECNLVGGQDEHVYAGGSFVADPDGGLKTAALFREDMLVVDIDLGCKSGEGCGSSSPDPSGDGEISELYQALVLAVRDYIDKNQIPGAAVSLSGGIDSALVAALAVDALGPGRVKCLTLPGPYTSGETLADAMRLAANLDVPIREISIVPVYEAASAALAEVLADGPADPEDLAGQNLQARIRGMFIMALANRRGLLALNCSNKSEAMVGYGTLYGDMVGGFSPLRDVWKTEVWELSRHVNALAGRERIPQSIIDRIPSAELRSNQEDRQSIPDYPILDAILGCFVDQGLPFTSLADGDFPRADVKKAIKLNYQSAFKRRQAPFGPIVTKPFTPERPPMPTVNRFRPWEE